MKDIKINKLQRNRDRWRHEAHKNPTDENGEPKESPETKSKRDQRKLNSKETFYLQKTAKKFGK